MQSLPLLIGDVRVPDCFSPSALGSWGGCALKLVAASLRRSDWEERLASGPEAAVGTLLHRILEQACRADGASAEALFEKEYERVAAALRGDPRRAHFADLRSTKSPAEWARLRSWVISRARTLGSSVGNGPRTPRDDRSRSVTGAEIQLESQALRLRGKADRIRRLGPSVFEVRDFKTGFTLDEDGAIKAEIALQLQAYGLLVLERQPAAQVRLIVDDGVDREVAFDEEARRTARESIKRITAAIPPPGAASTNSLAQPSSACWGCPVRHVCPGYRHAAPVWWKQYPRELERVSNDVWGTVLEVHGSGVHGASRVDIVIRDDAGRRVRIDGIDERHGLSLSSVGTRLWFFGLEASGVSRGFDGSRFHPRTFHELPRDRMERRAWTLHVFAENPKAK